MKSCGPRYEPCSYKNVCGKFIVKNRLLLVVNVSKKFKNLWVESKESFTFKLGFLSVSVIYKAIRTLEVVL
jgi:hypothetical protein